MKLIKTIAVILIINCFLLNSATAFAVNLSPPSAADSIKIQLLISEKEEAIQKKFQDAMQWMDEQKYIIEQSLANKFAEFRKRIEKVAEEITAKINELKDKITNRNYTLMQEQRRSNNSLPRQGFFMRFSCRVINDLPLLNG